MSAAVKGEYLIRIRSDQPPRVFLGDNVAGGEVVAVVDDNPVMVDIAWLLLRFPAMSRDTIRARLADIKQGTGKKCMYDRVQAMSLLAAKPKRRGRPRKN